MYNPFINSRAPRDKNIHSIPLDPTLLVCIVHIGWKPTPIFLNSIFNNCLKNITWLNMSVIGLVEMKSVHLKNKQKVTIQCAIF